jgi:hydroxymethylpyrimidine/phosphomethylpyrimidine kinase
VEAQGLAVLDDIGADAVKVGMLADAAIVEAAARLIDHGGVPAVIDPVMAAKGGASLLAQAAVASMKRELIPRAALLTPNAPEAAALTGLTVETPDDLRRAGAALLALGAGAVLMKGGHIEGPMVTDLLLTTDGEQAFSAPRIDSRHTHGTGCTLASACAAGIAQGMPLAAAVERAIGYVREAIAHAPGLGAGHGPLDHGWPLR